MGMSTMTWLDQKLICWGNVTNLQGKKHGQGTKMNISCMADMAVHFANIQHGFLVPFSL